jgi:hypothetical protein
LVGCGNQQGEVRIIRCRCRSEGIDSEEILSCRPHDAAVTSIAFIEDHSVLTGGNDRKIVRLDLRAERANDPIVRVFRLQLQCARMNVAGMKSEKEKDVLIALGARVCRVPERA